MTATPPALCTLAALLLCVASSSAVDLSWCEAAARTQAGWACGVRRRASSGEAYASFLGVPYAKQPIGELRFQELQQLDPWRGALNATTEGPICPQTDVLYKQLMQAKGGMSEACIHANIHVPCEALPNTNDYEEDTYEDEGAKSGLPIFVFLHGGGFAFGSGDTDLHGPEYLVSKGVMVVTFNYRLNVFGFLSLNSTSVPGNNGLRDAITLLGWLQRNAKFFGGNPDDVTIAGQSAGAVMTHLLTLSPAAEGLFRRAMIMSGTGPAEFYSSSPQFAKQIADMFLAAAGVDPALEADELHARLVHTPLDTLMSANKVLIDFFGLTTFVPVVESPHPGVKTILDEDPEVMMERGNGKNIPLIIGFTDAECEIYRSRLEEIDIAAKIAALPLIVVPSRLTYKVPLASWPLLIKAINSRYFNGSNVVDDFVNFCTDAYYKYPALRLAEKRAAIGGAPTYLYKFSYGGQHSVLKEAFHLSFKGAGHVEDLTYLFRVNSFLGPVGDEPLKTDEDDEMREQMTGYVVNFMRYSVPMPSPTRQSAWPPAGERLRYRDIAGARSSRSRVPSERELDMKRFFDALYANARD